MREHVSVLTDVNTRKQSKVLGAYGRHVLDKSGEILPGSAEQNKIAIFEHVLLRP